jgi:hypothetical protein
VRVRLPLSAPLYRGVVKLGNTADSKPVGRDCPCRCESGAATNLRPVRGTVDRAVLKTAPPFWRVGVQLTRFARGLAPHLLVRRSAALHAPAAPIFRRVVEWIHASLRNSWAKARAGANPVSPTNFSASSSKQFRRPASQAGNAGASPVEATISAA